MPQSAVRLADKFESFHEHWSPKIVATANGQWIKLAKFKGEFVWHAHAEQDEVFLVSKGEVVIHLRDDGGEREVRLAEGDLYVVPKGVEHKPAAENEAQVLIIAPSETTHTGGRQTPLTIANEDMEWI
jgi:mannose-6-phosphate isomerase-like protein (cupin superfamily)